MGEDECPVFPDSQGCVFQFPSVFLSPPVILVSDNWPARASVYNIGDPWQTYIFSHPWEDAPEIIRVFQTDAGVISELSDFPVVFAF